MRDQAELAKDVLWAGMGRILELWSKNRWDAALAMTPTQAEAFKRAVMEQIRI